MNIAIIPARSGSKRIKNKNIKNFVGKPIIARVIKKLKKNRNIKLIVVTSDSEKILKISKKNGANILIKRPKNLSNDFADTHSVIKHAINYLKLKNLNFENVFCIYPTSIFLNSATILKALKKLKKKNYVITGIKYNHPIERSFTNTNNRIKLNYPKKINSRTNDISSSYHDAAQLYLAKANTWLKDKKIISNNSSFVELLKYSSVDIDTIEDWYMAEEIYKKIKRHNEK